MSYSPTFSRDRRGKWPAEQNAGLTQVVAGSDAYIMEDEFNLLQWMLNEARADVVRKQVNSGVVEYNSSIAPTYDSGRNSGELMTPSASASNMNQMLLGGCTAYINGYRLGVHSNGYPAGANANLIQLDAPPTANVSPSLPGSARDDLVFLEAWFQEVSSVNGSADTNLYQYGGVNSGTATNDILDPRINAETTRRVQLRWRIRVVDGVDFGTYPEGFDDMQATQTGFNSAVLRPQGGASAPIATTNPTTWAYVFASNAKRNSVQTTGVLRNNDTGLYVAGLGDSTSQSLYNTVDGYVYAIPLFRVRRRNNAGFDPDSNPLGALDYISQLTTTTVALGATTVGISDGTKWNVGDIINIAGYTTPYTVTAISTNTLTFSPAYSNAALTVTGYTVVRAFSGRPDGLYSNIIDASDITDLRHQVSTTGFNYNALLEKNLDLLLRGQLTTNSPTRYGRDYVGLNTSGYTDDANSLLYLKFDGSMAGTANGTAVPNTKVGSGTEAYTNGIQGQGADFTNAYGEEYAAPIPASNWTVEGFFRPNWSGNVSTQADLFVLLSASTDSLANRTGMAWCDTNGFHFEIFDSSNNAHAPSAISMSNMKAGEWHYFKVTYDGSTVTAQLDEKTSTLSFTGGRASTNIIVGDEGISSNLSFHGQVDLLRISNIVRTGTPLPSNFSYANGDRLLDGPMSDFAQWSDDLGGTAGVGGRTNPYGLARVPNAVAARVNVNGSEIRHYYGNGLTPGWVANTAIGSNPTGAFDPSGERLFVPANETADGTRTTFTFNQPTNGQGILALYASNFTQLVQVSAAYVTPSSVSITPTTSQYTVTFSTAPANGASVQILCSTVQRHTHFIPSTKGLVIHDWTDDSLAANGTATVFQTSKYSVNSVNYVGVTATGNTARTIQNGGYTVSGTGANTTLAASAASSATTITVASGTGFVANQNIRISKGDGTWYTTTVTSVAGTTITVPALTVALTSGATVQGAALVTFTTAPAAGTVDLVYESVFTPSLGDYIRAMYQHTPYQGVIAANDSYTILAEAPALVTSLGTGAVYTGAYSGTAGMTACTVNLPTAVPDYNLKNDNFIGNTRSSVAAKPMIQSTWDDVPYSASYNYRGKRIGQTVMVNTLSPQPRGIPSNALGSGAGLATLYSEQISAAVPTKAVFVQLIKDQNGLLKLLIFVRQTSANQPQVEFVFNTSTAVDAFHIQGRPLIKSYAGVTA